MGGAVVHRVDLAMKKPRLFLTGFALVALVALVPIGCATKTERRSPSTPPAPATETAKPQTASHDGFTAAMSPADFLAHVKTLASDAFGGRRPGSEGETKTVAYLVEQLERMGLAPGNGGRFTQSVPMVETTTDPTSVTMSIETTVKTHRLRYGDDMVVGTRSGRAAIDIQGSEVVFVGYGVVAPEAGWNDYAGIDVKGKTVVMLVNDPGFHVGDPDLFAGRKMTYYGRWTYKNEEAVRQGATAALIIHDTDGAGYGWDVVKNSWTGPQFDLPASEDPEPRLDVEGWISADTALALFADAGLDFQTLRRAASQRGFRPVSLGAKLNLSLRCTTRTSASSNVVAMLRGTTRPDEAVVYTAHWDHLGTAETGTGDRIYNGAVDNATGVAGVLELAERFTALDPAPERSLIFLFVTLEESGLLGSKYYTAHPSVPLANTVAVINLDALPVIGPTKDFVVVGLGNSELDDIVRPIAEAQDRVLVEESAPEKGFFFRSDHFNFAKRGVPALYGRGGIDHTEKGKAFGLSLSAKYVTTLYHKPGDQVYPSWDLRGVMQDLEILFEVARRLAMGDQWPNYVEGNRFRAARDDSRRGEPR